MPIIKLNAIDSTNDYLKQLSRSNELENFTVVMADSQTKGRGQMGTQWTSEQGKNLTMSILIKDLPLQSLSVFDINITIALATANTLIKLEVPNVKIKWPNDIMAGAKKVGGILIENSLKADGSMTTVVGIGINLNQTNFDQLPQASSLTCITNKTYDVEEFASILTEELKKQISLLPSAADAFWNDYYNLLFKKNEISVFEDTNSKRFNGIIQNVTKEGKLAVLLENDKTEYFELKEIKMLY